MGGRDLAQNRVGGERMTNLDVIRRSQGLRENSE